MKKEDLFIYDYKLRSDIIGENIDDTLRILYNNAYPKTDFDKEILVKCKELNQKAIDENKSKDDVFIFRDPNTDQRYIYPLDFYYVPFEFYKMVIDNLCEAYGINRTWEDDIDILTEYINNVDNRAVIEVYNTDSNGITQKEYKKIGSLKDALSNIINDDNKLDEVYAKILEYIDNCKNFYKFGLINENHFRGGVAFHSPNSNRDTVIKAWKAIYNKDIIIPDDSCWIDCYDEKLNDIEED